MSLTTLAQLKNIIGDTIPATTLFTVVLSAAVTVIVIMAISSYLFTKADLK